MTLTLKWHGPKVKKAARRGAVRGLQLGAEHVLEESNRVVPIDDSDLLKSGVPSVDNPATGEPRGAVSYDTPYAVRQHEELDWQHEDGRTAKYLENTINDPTVVRKTTELVAREVKRELT